jgi:hypothetical protein
MESSASDDDSGDHSLLSKNELERVKDLFVAEHLSSNKEQQELSEQGASAPEEDEFELPPKRKRRMITELD